MGEPIEYYLNGLGENCVFYVQVKAINLTLVVITTNLVALTTICTQIPLVSQSLNCRGIDNGRFI